MAAIDALLRLLTSQNAEALQLESDAVPRLTRKGEQVPLSMPPLGAALLQTFVDELLPAEQRQAVRQRGEVAVEHGEFLVTVKAQGAAGWTLLARVRAPGEPAARGGPAGAASSGSVAPPPLPVRSAPPAAAPGSHAAAASQLWRWLDQLLDSGGSDLLVSSGRGAWQRLQGGLQQQGGQPLLEDQLLALLLAGASESQQQAFEAHGSADLAFVHESDQGRRRFRVNLFRQAGGVAASFRPVRQRAPSLEELRLPASLTRLVGYPHGLVLVTGPAGAGKSTTLTALIEHLNRGSSRHIITLEDPIEHEYLTGSCLVHQRELGRDLPSFEAGLRAALREAPDLILLGEMRDRATMAAALTAAETGHLVLSTLHAGNPAMAVERIIDAFPEHQQAQVRLQLAQTLRAILTQHLLPSRSGAGRVPVLELLLSTSAVLSMIREGKTYQLQSAIQTGREEGMIALDRSLAERVAAGEISLEVASTVTLDGGAQPREVRGRRGR